MRLAVDVERRVRGVVAEADGAALVGYARERDPLVEHEAARDRGLLAAQLAEQVLELPQQPLVRLEVVVLLV